MSDVFSLACVYLDLITFVLRGKTTDFVKFRSQCSSTTNTSSFAAASSNSSTYSNGSPPQITRTRAHKPRPDTSFHSLDPSRLDAWLSHLRAESTKRPEPIFRCVPELLRMCKRMMAQNATLRPNAQQVRDCVQIALEAEGATRKLCCVGRVWDHDGEDVPGLIIGSAKGERERMRSSLMGAAQGGRSSVLSQRGYGETEIDDGGVDIDVDAGAEAPDVPRERARTDSFSGSVSEKTKGWRRAFARVRSN
jgi:hypothetical protein